MKPRITVLTIGVNNLQKSLKFYRDGPGCPQDPVGHLWEVAWNPAWKK